MQWGDPYLFRLGVTVYTLPQIGERISTNSSGETLPSWVWSADHGLREVVGIPSHRLLDVVFLVLFAHPLGPATLETARPR